jgi:hypothetical protein
MIATLRRIFRKKLTSPVAVARDPASVELRLREEHPGHADHVYSEWSWLMAQYGEALDLDPFSDRVLALTRAHLAKLRAEILDAERAPRDPFYSS